jgi:hypothetical protein
MTNPEALKALYVALGGDASAVADDNLTVEVLNALAAKFEGEADADTIPEAIENITAVAENIGGGNPNETGTIEGTAAAPFGTLGFQYVIEQMELGNLSGTLKLDASALGAGVVTLPMITDGTYLNVVGAQINGDGTSASHIVYTINGLAQAWMEDNGEATDISAYAASVPTIFNYIYHPLPEDDNE